MDARQLRITFAKELPDHVDQHLPLLLLTKPRVLLGELAVGGEVGDELLGREDRRRNPHRPEQLLEQANALVPIVRVIIASHLAIIAALPPRGK